MNKQFVIKSLYNIFIFRACPIEKIQIFNESLILVIKLNLLFF